jgi:hypothetical protein
MARWYLFSSSSSAAEGPYTVSELEAMARKGDLDESSLVVIEGGQEWDRVDQDPTLLAMLNQLRPQYTPLAAALVPTSPSPATATPATAGATVLATAGDGGVSVTRRESISASAAVQAGVDRLRWNPSFYIPAALLITLASSIPGIGYVLITGPLIIGFYQAVRQEQVTGEKARVLAIFGGFRQLISSLVIVFWGTAAALVGFLCCCVPGFALLPLPFMAYIAVARDNQGGINALTRAFRVMEKDPFGFLAAVLLVSIVGLSGVVLFYFGLALTLPIMLVGYYSIVDQMLRTEDA